MAQLWFTDREALVEFVTPIDDLCHNKEEWAISVAEIPSDSRARSASRNAVDIFKCSKEDVQSQIDVLKEKPGSALTFQAKMAMSNAGMAEMKWRLDRSSGTGKAGAAFQTSMTALSRFLDNFSGLAEIAKAADQQYGGLAYGTFSLMLSLYVHKTKREETLREGFDELGFAFPRLETLQGIRRQGTEGEAVSFLRLESLILKTFCLVIVFARDTAQYYSSKLRRVKDTFRTEQATNKTLLDIRRHLEEVRKETDILMLTKIDALQLRINQISITVNKTFDQTIQTEHSLRRARSSADTTHLANLRQILDVKETSTHTNLEKCKSLLADAFFSGYAIRPKHSHPKKVSMELLRSETEFEKWWESPTSCLLLAGGSNSEDSHQSGSLNWLSYGAILAVEELRRQNRNVAFFLAQTTFTIERRRCHTQEVMAALLYQIAEMHDDLLRSKVDKLKAVVQSPAWSSGNSDIFMSKMKPLLQDIFSAFPRNEEIFIIIDRLDQCAWEEDDNGMPDDDMRHSIEALVHVAAQASCHVKLLLTIDAAWSQRLARVRNSLRTRKEKSTLLLKSDWCQAIDDDESEDEL